MAEEGRNDRGENKKTPLPPLQEGNKISPHFVRRNDREGRNNREGVIPNECVLIPMLKAIGEESKKERCFADAQHDNANVKTPLTPLQEGNKISPPMRTSFERGRNDRESGRNDKLADNRKAIIRELHKRNLILERVGDLFYQLAFFCYLYREKNSQEIRKTNEEKCDMLFKRKKEQKRDSIMKKIKFIFKIFVLTIYFVTTFNEFSYANAVMMEQGMGFNLPPAIGKIIDTFEGTTKDKIILIQDLHCNPKVQENIYKILERAKKSYGKDLQTIGIEGTPLVKINTEILKKMPENVREKIVNYLVQNGYISGAEWFEIMNGKAVVLKGIEDEELYKKNFMALYNSLGYRDELEYMFEEIKTGYEQAKRYFWTKEVNDLLEKKERFNKGGMSLREYVSYLRDTSTSSVSEEMLSVQVSEKYKISRYARNDKESGRNDKEGVIPNECVLIPMLKAIGEESKKERCFADAQHDNANVKTPLTPLQEGNKISPHFVRRNDRESGRNDRKSRNDFAMEYPQLNAYLGLAEIKNKVKPNLVKIEAGYLLNNLLGIVSEKEIENLKKYSQKNRDEYYLYLKSLVKNKNLNINSNYKNLTAYFRYLDELEKVDEALICEEKERLEYEILEKMLKNRKDGTELLYSSYYVGVMERYLWNKASIKDVEEWENEQDRIKRIEGFSDRLLRKPYFKESEELLKKARENMEEFYKDAEKRNEILAKNILSKEFNKSRVSVMVLGGFHAEGLKNYLKSAGVSYKVVVPAVDSLEAEGIYEKRLKEQAGVLINANANVTNVKTPLTPLQEGNLRETSYSMSLQRQEGNKISPHFVRRNDKESGRNDREGKNDKLMLTSIFYNKELTYKAFKEMFKNPIFRLTEIEFDAMKKVFEEQKEDDFLKMMEEIAFEYKDERTYSEDITTILDRLTQREEVYLDLKKMITESKTKSIFLDLAAKAIQLNMGLKENIYVLKEELKARLVLVSRWKLKQALKEEERERRKLEEMKIKLEEINQSRRASGLTDIVVELTEAKLEEETKKEETRKEQEGLLLTTITSEILTARRDEKNVGEYIRQLFYIGFMIKLEGRKAFDELEELGEIILCIIDIVKKTWNEIEGNPEDTKIKKMQEIQNKARQFIAWAESITEKTEETEEYNKIIIKRAVMRFIRQTKEKEKKDIDIDYAMTLVGYQNEVQRAANHRDDAENVQKKINKIAGQIISKFNTNTGSSRELKPEEIIGNIVKLLAIEKSDTKEIHKIATTVVSALMNVENRGTRPQVRQDHINPFGSPSKESNVKYSLDPTIGELKRYIINIRAVCVDPISREKISSFAEKKGLISSFRYFSRENFNLDEFRELVLKSATIEDLFNAIKTPEGSEAGSLSGTPIASPRLTPSKLTPMSSPRGTPMRSPRVILQSPKKTLPEMLEELKGTASLKILEEAKTIRIEEVNAEERLKELQRALDDIQKQLKKFTQEQLLKYFKNVSEEMEALSKKLNGPREVIIDISGLQDVKYIEEFLKIRGIIERGMLGEFQIKKGFRVILVGNFPDADKKMRKGMSSFLRQYNMELVIGTTLYYKLQNVFALKNAGKTSIVLSSGHILRVSKNGVPEVYEKVKRERYEEEVILKDSSIIINTLQDLKNFRVINTAPDGMVYVSVFDEKGEIQDILLLRNQLRQIVSPSKMVGVSAKLFVKVFTTPIMTVVKQVLKANLKIGDIKITSLEQARHIASAA